MPNDDDDAKFQDKTGLLLISNLAFTSSYSMQLTSLSSHSNETFLVETPKCLDLVDDPGTNLARFQGVQGSAVAQVMG